MQSEKKKQRDWELIVFQSRVGDRSPIAMNSSAPLGRMLADRLGIPLRILGTVGRSATDDWHVALSEARHELDGLHAAAKEIAASEKSAIFILPKCAGAIATTPPFLEHHDGSSLFWLDAHGDFNTPSTTTSQYIGGMALSGICGLWETGYCSKAAGDSVILVGARDLEHQERQLLKAHRVPIAKTSHGLLTGDLPAARPFAFVHIDCDVYDPRFVTSEMAVANGMTPQGVQNVIAAISSSSDIVALNISEFECDTRSALFHAQAETILAAIRVVV
jgi:arginase/N-omega-hydroxy-L-arginine amidinohydrolase